MPTTKPSKHLKRKKPICKKFGDAVEKTKEQTHEYWDQMALPKHKSFNRKPKPSKPKGSHKTIKEKLKAKAYELAEIRDEGYCVLCGKPFEEHHHIIKQGTRYGPEYIQRMENVVLVCKLCHTMGFKPIHDPKGKSEKQIYLEQWQQKYYPEYSAMMKELAKVTGCRDQWLIDRWLSKQAIGV